LQQWIDADRAFAGKMRMNRLGSQRQKLTGPVQPFYLPLEFVTTPRLYFFLPPNRRVSLVLSMNLDSESLGIG
jgi:hypothetical protein